MLAMSSSPEATNMLLPGDRVKLRCPKCKSSTFELAETCEEIHYIDVIDGVVPDKVTDKVAGDILGTKATCRCCGHAWTPRAKSLDSVDQN